MPTLVKLRNRAQITLPKETVKKLNLKEGDNLSVEVSNGKVLITPVAIIPKDELWAWSSKVRSAIEEGKLEANEGKLKEYDNVEEIWKNMQVAED
jgi:antitoxin MazE